MLTLLTVAALLLGYALKRGMERRARAAAGPGVEP
jgi:mannopine transport system permease protein